MIAFTSHALLKLAQRKILRELVEEVVERPDYRLESYGGGRVFYRRFGERFLKVVIVEEHESIIVITQHWDSTFKPE